MFYDFEFKGTDAGLDFSIRLDPDKQLYCFIGKNGVGKTNLLQNLARTLLARHSMFQTALVANSGKRFKYAQVLATQQIHDAYSGRFLRLPLQMRVEDAAMKTDLRWRVVDVQQLQHYGGSLALKTSSVCDRPVVMVSARGRGHTQNLSASELRPLGNSESTFLSAFENTWVASTGEDNPLESVAHWIASRLLINPAFVVGASNRGFAVEQFCKALMLLDPIAFKGLSTRNEKTLRFDISFFEGSLLLMSTPIDKLATGYIAAVKIVQEIIAAFDAWSWIVGSENIADVDGIVLIDEIDAHLHPAWQTRLLTILRECFPKATFVVTTHSPTVIANTLEGEAYELVRTGNSVTSRRLGSPKDWYLADILSSAFHVDTTPHFSNGDEQNAANSLVDQLLQFSGAVKDFVNNGRRDEQRLAAIELHEQLIQRMSEGDPRRVQMEPLRKLLG